MSGSESARALNVFVFVTLVAEGVLGKCVPIWTKANVKQLVLRLLYLDHPELKVEKALQKRPNPEGNQSIWKKEATTVPTVTRQCTVSIM